VKHLAIIRSMDRIVREVACGKTPLPPLQDIETNAAWTSPRLRDAEKCWKCDAVVSATVVATEAVVAGATVDEGVQCGQRFVLWQLDRRMGERNPR